MAYTSIIPVHRLDRTVTYVQNKEKTTRPAHSRDSAASLEEAVDYALNRDKTERACFESALGCTCESAFADMVACKQRWRKMGGVQGYHLVQSFAAGEVTPELAHQIGVELAEQLLGGRYQAIVTIHLNTGHYHNHIVWNSVALQDGRKYHSNAKTYVTEIRALSDKLCREHGLSVIDSERAAQVSKPYAEWQAERDGQPTWRTAIRQDVDEAAAHALTWRQFLRLLEYKGYTFHLDRKYPTLQPPGKARPVRFKTLGRQYTPEAIQMRILYPSARQNPAGADRPPVIRYARLRGSHARPRRKLTGLRALYFRYLYALGVLPRKPRRPGYAVREDIRHLDRRIEQMEYLSRHGIDTLEQLEQRRQAAEDAIRSAAAQRRQLYRAGSSEEQIGPLTARLKALRREEKLCRQIAAQSKEMAERLQADREQAAAQRQREQEREQARRPQTPYLL